MNLSKDKRTLSPAAITERLLTLKNKSHKVNSDNVKAANVVGTEVIGRYWSSSVKPTIRPLRDDDREWKATAHNLFTENGRNNAEGPGTTHGGR